MNKNNNTQIPKVGEVDVVYIWCDPSNPDYIKNRKMYSQQYNLSTFWSQTRDHGEIQVSIKSVRKYMKWVRNIFVCAPKNHRIENLDTKRYNVKYVDNEEILGEKNCPNFNSHSLELFTYKIKGLSDYFIQFNDDLFVINDVTLDDFYNFSTKKIKFYYEDFLKLGKPSSSNTRRIIHNITGDSHYFWATHSPKMFCKKDIENIVKTHVSICEQTKKAKFRTQNDLQLVYFYGYYLLSKGKGKFIFLNNIVKIKKFFAIKLFVKKLFSEKICSVIKQAYLQVFYKKYLYEGKIFIDKKIYSLVNLTNNCKENKENIDYAFDNNVKFFCLNDTYKTKNNEKINQIYTENYQYFYNKLLDIGKK